MARRSSEDISASMWRAGGEPPPPPEYLSPAAKVEWWAVVNDRPPDFFRASNFGVLASYCTILVAAKRLFAYFERREISANDYNATIAEVSKLSSTLLNYASRLRLTPSSEIDRRSGKLAEHGPPDDPDGVLFGDAIKRSRLLGGYATRPGKAADGVVDLSTAAKRRPRKPKLDAPPL
jgi:phage terminase small subunit